MRRTGHCRPVAPYVPQETVSVRAEAAAAGLSVSEFVRRRLNRALVAGLPGVGEVKTELSFEPPWTPERMSEDAKFILGFG